MKYTYFQLATQLTTQAPLYVIHGAEPFLVQEIVARVKKTLALPTERFTVNNNEDAGSLYNILHSTSLLAAKRFIIIELKVMPAKAINQCLEAYTKNPNPEQHVLIQFDHVDYRCTKSAWFAETEKNGIVVTLWPFTEAQMSQWITQRLQKYQLSLTKEALRYLIAETTGNIAAAACAIEKLVLANATPPIDLNEVQTLLTSGDHRFTPFKMTEALILGNATDALKVLKYLVESGTELSLILWHIMHKLRTTLPKAFSPQKAHYLSYFKSMTEIDAMIKSGRSQEAYEALQLFCLRWSSSCH